MHQSDKDWWRNAVIYQIYPRSFLDSNKDGIGDIKGIISKIEYLKSLEVDAIWLSPIFKSPMNDMGYDVSDYFDIDPLFGNMDDFEELINICHKNGLKLIIDQVYSHTSDEHPFFKQSKKDKENDKADWYVWADPKEDGGPPNNWLSVFGGSAWEWSSKRRQYYLHNFLKSQPDLNFHNIDVQNWVLSIADFWLKKGVDGFRLDVANYYFHDSKLRDNPSRKNIKIPDDTSEFGINASNQRFWEEPVKRYISECLFGTEGNRKKNFNMRWVAAMVCDVHRIICRGGTFMYPIDEKTRNNKCCSS